MNYYPFHIGETLAQKNAKLRRDRLAAAREKASHTSAEWQDLVRRFSFRCVRCGCLHSKLQKDHIIPIYQGGSDGIDNLQPLCQPCNGAKGPDAFNWAAHREQFGFDEVAP